MKLFLEALTNLVIVCLSSTSKGGRGSFHVGEEEEKDDMESDLR